MTEIIGVDGAPLLSMVSQKPQIVTFPSIAKSRAFRPDGELIEAFGPDYRVVPASQWTDTPLIDIAIQKAIKVFRRKSNNMNVPVLRFDETTILVQEYRKQDRLVVIVAQWGRQMGMREWGWLYHTTVFRIEGKLKEDLILAGRWSREIIVSVEAIQ